MSDCEFKFETLRHDSRGGEKVIEVTYAASRPVAARLYGDYPQPAEGSECEILKVSCGGEEINLFDNEYQALLDLCHERVAEDFAGHDADAEEYRAEARAERLAEERLEA